MDASELFLLGHAHIQARAQRVCEGLSEDQLRQCPSENFNSIAWLIWHMARCEDVMVNTVTRNVPEVLDRDNWPPRLGVTTRHIGTGATHDEVETFSRQAEVAALQAYWSAVRQETQSWVAEADFATLDKPVTADDAQRAGDRGAFCPRAAWVQTMWASGKSTHLYYLVWLGIGHNHSHLGEAVVIRGLLGLPLG